MVSLLPEHERGFRNSLEATVVRILSPELWHLQKEICKNNYLRNCNAYQECPWQHQAFFALNLFFMIMEQQTLNWSVRKLLKWQFCMHDTVLQRLLFVFFPLRWLCFRFLKESSASVGYLLLVKTSGGVVYPSVLYCKVHGISREREKKKPLKALPHANLPYRMTLVYQNCAKCILRVSIAYRLWEKKIYLESWSLSFFSSKLCWCCIVSNIKPNLYIYKRVAKWSLWCRSVSLCSRIHC